MTTFAELGIRSDIARGIDDLGFTAPTPIQTRIIPLLLEKKCDIIGLAQTGTGKTAAFGIPLIQTADMSSRKHPQSLVLCPTRELCMQVAKDIEALAKHVSGLQVATVYGGAPITWQINAIARGAQIIVATPGRLNDILRRGAVSLAGIRTVVLDEADEMLQMGFQEEINTILAETPTDKNTLLFSATMPKAIAAITGRFMRNPVEVTIGARNSGAENVRHTYYVARPRDRYAAMKRIIDSTPDMYAIIFCRTKVDARQVADQLIEDGYGADALHGDLSQGQRDSVMQKFRRAGVRLLVATDVAARGLDVNDLSHVIHYNLPDDLANYTHRSGRTGRAGRTGVSISIIQPLERSRLREIEMKLKARFEKCRIPSGNEICQQQVLSLVDSLNSAEVENEQFGSLLAAVGEKLAHLDREELLRRFVAMEFGKVLAYYQNAPDLNAAEREKPSSSAPMRGMTPHATEHFRFTGLRLNVGKKDGIHAARLIGAINDAAGMPRVRIGRIDIGPSTAMIEAETKYAPQVQNALRLLSVNGKQVMIELLGDSSETFAREERPRRPASAKIFKPGRKKAREDGSGKTATRW